MVADRPDVILAITAPTAEPREHAHPVHLTGLSIGQSSDPTDSDCHLGRLRADRLMLRLESCIRPAGEGPVWGKRRSAR
jgi:hypothetical protein